jgi:hypothetical protein
MYAQLIYLDGPRTPELVAAGDRAGRERVAPAVAGDPVTRAAHIPTYVLRQPDGTEVVVIISETEAALQRGNEVVAGTTLLAGEDPALLPGPDRIETYQVVHALDRDFEPMEVRS